MEKIKVFINKLLYGAIFVIILPALLILWAEFTSPLITLPIPGNEISGYLLLSAGIMLLLSGMMHLWFFGHGLPMNAFPPSILVKTGIYALTRHPIYSGAVLMSFGISIIAQSSSGFWLISPLFTLMIIAYVIGFENERTKIIFENQEYRTFLSLPDPDKDSPSGGDRVSAYLLAFLPWSVVYEVFIFAGVPSNAVVTNLPFEHRLPVFEFTELFYSFTYVFVLLIPMIIKKNIILRRFIIDIWTASIVVGLIYFVFPFIVDQRDFSPHTFLGRLIISGRGFDAETAALPSFHVIWAFIAARYFTESYKNYKWLWYSIAFLISASCVTTGNHSIPDVIAGFLIFITIIYRAEIWNQIRTISEKLANSWHEWRWGPVRLINHGLYGGAAGFSGTLVAGFFLGQRFSFMVPAVMIFVIIGAGLWAQLIEGSPRLLRPYGYYGGLTGGVLGCILFSLIFPINLFVILGALAMAAPWIQAIGRLRCLVQGCCHGRPSDESIGIRFTHPLSRVNKISGLNGVALHPTQLYSICCNIISGLVLARLFTIGMPAVFITGVYFILNGLGRFVEESFRGEAQTPYWKGMRIYQWVALVNISAGAVLTTIPDASILSFEPNIESLVYAQVIGIIVTFASGVDFPESNRRFARLTSN